MYIYYSYQLSLKKVNFRDVTNEIKLTAMQNSQIPRYFECLHVYMIIWYHENLSSMLSMKAEIYYRFLSDVMV